MQKKWHYTETLKAGAHITNLHRGNNLITDCTADNKFEKAITTINRKNAKGKYEKSRRRSHHFQVNLIVTVESLF